VNLSGLIASCCIWWKSCIAFSGCPSFTYFVRFWFHLQSYKEYIRAQWLFNIQIHLQLGWNFLSEMWDPCEVQLNFGEDIPILSMVTFNIHVHLQFDWISQEWNVKSLVSCKLSFPETCESKWLNFSRAEWEIIVRCGSYSEIINFDHGDFQYTNSHTVELNFSRVKW
jgi:hypothetical protein